MRIRFDRLMLLLLVCLVGEARADQFDDTVRQVVGWGWQNARHGQTLASDVLGQFADGDPAHPSFGSYGPYGGANDHGFFFFAFNSGRRHTLAGMAAHPGIRKLAVPDYWNHRVLLFDLNADGSLLSRRASGLIGQQRFDRMEIGLGPDRFNYPADCAFDPSGKFLFVADQFNNRVLQFDMAAPQRAVRVYGQGEFDATPMDMKKRPTTDLSADGRGLLLPRGVACDGRRVFVSDYGNHRVMVFDMSGADNGPTAVAVLGQADFDGSKNNRGGSMAMETMCYPSGLALDDGNRHLLVADSMNRRVLIFDVSGRIQNGMAASAVLELPPPDPSGDPTLAAKEEEKLPIDGVVDVAVDAGGRVFAADHAGARVTVYHLNDALAGRKTPRAALGRFEMMSDLDQSKSTYIGPTGLACAGRFLYVAEPRGNRVLCYDGSNPDQPAVNLLGQCYGNDLTRPDFHKYGPNNGPDPYGFDFADGVPAVSVTQDGRWLLAADSIGGRLLFFPLDGDGLPLDRSSRLAMGVPTLTARANNYGAEHFNRSGYAVMSRDGGLFATDFQGSRVLYFQLPDFAAAATSQRALEPLRPFAPPTDRKPGYREWFEFRSIHSGVPASAVLGQEDFDTGLRDVASIRQFGKEMSGIAMDHQRQWLFITDKLSHRVVIVDVSKGVSTFMPALAVLGQPDFDHNAPNWGQGDKKNPAWHPRGMMQPHSSCYDHATKRLFVVNGRDGADREILCFDLSGSINNGMEPAMRIGGRHATVQTDLPEIGDWLAIDEKNRRLWSDLYAVDIANLEKGAPVIGYFGTDKNRSHEASPAASRPDTQRIKNRLGYAVTACHRFGGPVDALAVNPRTGTVYVGDTERYRMLCFRPEFHFETEPLKLTIGQPAIGLTGAGGLSPLQFEVDTKTVPAGLSIDPDNGLIRGTPGDKPGEYRVGVKVKSALGEVNGARTIVLAK
jgi:sugar lactone lactonase YvrE